jgi:hypothetical protein
LQNWLTHKIRSILRHDQKRVTKLLRIFGIEQYFNLSRSDKVHLDQNILTYFFLLKEEATGMNQDVKSLSSETRATTSASSLLLSTTSATAPTVVQPLANTTTSSSSPTNIVTKDDFDIITRQLDCEIMLSYTKYIYGLSNENPMLNFGYQHSQVPTPIQQQQQQVLYEEPSIHHQQVDIRDRSLSLSRISSKTNDFFSKTKSKLENHLLVKPISSSANLSSTLNDEDLNSLLLDDNFDNTSLLEQLEADRMTISSSSGIIMSTTATTDSLKEEAQISLTVLTATKTEIQEKNKQKSKKIIKLKLNNMKLYAQTLNDNALALVKLNQISISNVAAKSSGEVLVKFKKCGNLNLLELLLNEFKFSIDMSLLTRLLDVVDDKDNFHFDALLNQPKMPINVYIKKSCFNLNTEEKPIDLEVENLIVSRLANQKLIIREMHTTELDESNKQLNVTQRVFKDLEKLVKYQSKSKGEGTGLFINQEKYASLIYMFRKSKQELIELKLRLNEEKKKHNTEKCSLIAQLSQTRQENQELRSKIEETTKITKLQTDLNVINLIDIDETEIENNKKLDEDFELTNKNDERESSMLKIQFEIERKQFECLLKQLEEENETLKKRLLKSEDHITLLNIERECLMKNLNKLK